MGEMVHKIKNKAKPSVINHQMRWKLHLIANWSWYLAKPETAEEKPGKNRGVVKGSFTQPSLSFGNSVTKAAIWQGAWGGEMSFRGASDLCVYSVRRSLIKSLVCSGSYSCHFKMFQDDSAKVLHLEPILPT